MPVNNQSPYPLRPTRISPRQQKRRNAEPFIAGGLVAVIVLSGIFILPQAITTEVNFEQAKPVPLAVQSVPFPVTVDPATKSITDSAAADAFFKSKTEDVTASAGLASEVLDWIASLIDNTHAYQSLAAADGHLITILPGDRKEQIVAKLAYALNWNKAQQQEFITYVASSTPAGGVTDGIYAPGTYVVSSDMTPSNVAALMNIAFDRSILVHYGTSTQQQVPLGEALTVASLLEREASGPTDMRIISGIIWNRLFNNMNLQIDATLQYAKGETKSGDWWSNVVPKDKYISSAYNTYAHPGLPPGPIANPSLAAVLAALNPEKTSCLYYFHDANGNFHCSDTYAEHVALLKKYYGQGK